MTSRTASVCRVKLGVAGFLLCLMASNSYADCNDPPTPDVDWQGCDKSWAQLQNADLSNANLTNTTFNHANLQGANLSNADLTGASLLGVNLQGVNLTAAKVISAFMTKSRIAGANLTNAVFDETYWVNGQQCQAGSSGQCNY